MASEGVSTRSKSKSGSITTAANMPTYSQATPSPTVTLATMGRGKFSPQVLDSLRTVGRGSRGTPLTTEGRGGSLNPRSLRTPGMMSPGAQQQEGSHTPGDVASILLHLEKQRQEEREEERIRRTEEERQRREENEEKERQRREEKEEKERRRKEEERQRREEKDEKERQRREEKEEKERQRREEKEERERRRRDEERQRKEEERAWRERQEQWLEAKLGALAQGGSMMPQARPIAPPSLKLPEWKAGDDIDAFLDHFELAASTYELTPAQKLLYLSGNLTGRAREVYVSLGHSATYHTLCTALRRQFRLSPEAYRRKFRGMKKEFQESYIQFGTRLEKTLQHWTDLSESSLKDLILIEQLMNTVTPELKIKLGETNPKDFQTAVEIAESFSEARRLFRPRRFGGIEENEENEPMGKQGFGLKNEDAEQTHRKSWQPTTKGQCHKCGLPGHTIAECPNPRGKGGNWQSAGRAEVSFSGVNSVHDQPVFLSKVEGKVVDTIRDTGATTIVVDEELVPPGAPRGPDCLLTPIEGEFTRTRPTVLVHLCTPYFSGRVWAISVANPPQSLLLGNVVHFEEGEASSLSPQYPEHVSAAVVTRSQARKELKQLEPAHQPELDAIAGEIDLQAIRRLQGSDPAVQALKQRLGQPPKETVSRCVTFEEKAGVLYRIFVSNGDKFTQVVLPQALAPTVLRTAHDLPMAGHMSTRRTKERIHRDFYWPGMNKDVQKFCQSCDQCQRTTSKGRNTRVPLGKVPVVGEPFAKVGVDLVGPMIPPSSRGHQYILVQGDYATRYPDATPLRNIRARTVAEALWEMWSRTGIPGQVLTDQGAQFTSKLMCEVYQLLSIKKSTTTPYHAQANGLVERFNGTLKQMLRRLCKDKPRDWDRHIPAVLFAYREVPQESMRFSPFELLYGRTVRGPIAVLKHLWTQEEEEPEAREETQFLVDLRNRVAHVCELAQQNLQQAAARYKQIYDRRSAPRAFVPGEEVLLLLPQRKNKLQLEWQGPFTVMERIGEGDYKIDLRGKHRIYHANLLKRYYRRETAGSAFTPVVVELDQEGEDSALHDIPTVPLISTETWRDIGVANDLHDEQKREIKQLCEEFQDVLSDCPLKCKVGECALRLTSDAPIRVKQYPLPHSQTETINQEVKAMLEMGVIERAKSPYSAPVLLVKKKDGKMRFCIDYRKLNQVLIFDGEPMPDVQGLFAQLGRSTMFSKLDLTKGYWQVPMRHEDKAKTAFTTSDGQFQWRVMPFGLKTAGAVFSRTMREVLSPLQTHEAINFIDDLLVHTVGWDRHLQVLRCIFTRLREVQLAARPTKCHFGDSRIVFLGHGIAHGEIRPEEDKVDKVAWAPPPTTKKELRSFLGLAGYYRKFIPKFADVALPLTNLTKKRQPEKLLWDQECDQAFSRLKTALTSEPVLILPDPALPFVLRTDASGTGIGAALLQDRGKGLQPIGYESKKLSDAERRYHTIEQECLAVVWGIRKYYPFLYGKEFTLQTDHHPLQYIDRIRPVSRRLMGWAIELQSYAFKFEHIPGRLNVEADYLSRKTEA